jgi:hypothetical protein
MRLSFKTVLVIICISLVIGFVISVMLYMAGITFICVDCNVNDIVYNNCTIYKTREEQFCNCNEVYVKNCIKDAPHKYPYSGVFTVVFLILLAVSIIAGCILYGE